MAGELGLRVSPDTRHKELFPLTAATMPVGGMSAPVGTLWYTNFDDPVWDTRGRFWIVGKDSNNLGTVRGGHCYCFKQDGVTDNMTWYRFYDQGSEGACVGFGVSRAITMNNRKRYDAPWVYHEAQLIDPWNDTPPGEGTDLRSGLEIARTRGLRRVYAGSTKPEDITEGISVYRWAMSIDDFITAMASPRYLELGRAPFLNSWGGGYPHLTWMPLETMNRLHHENGDFAVLTDR